MLGCALAAGANALAPAAESAAAVAATSYYVSPAGDDAGTGTLAAPFRTIQKGFSSVGPGGVLFVRHGTYDSGVVCRHTCPNLATGTAAAPILIRNHPGEVATIRAEIEFHNLRYVTIQGLRFTKNPAAYNSDTSLINIYHGDHWVFRNNEVFGAQHYALTAINGAATNYRMKNNCLHDIAMVPKHGLGHDHGIYVTGFPDVVARAIIERNIVFNSPGGAAIKVGHLIEERPGVPCNHNPNTVTVRRNSTFNNIINMRLVHASQNISIDENVFVKSHVEGPTGQQPEHGAGAAPGAPATGSPATGPGTPTVHWTPGTAAGLRGRGDPPTSPATCSGVRSSPRGRAPDTRTPSLPPQGSGGGRRSRTHWWDAQGPTNGTCPPPSRATR